MKLSNCGGKIMKIQTEVTISSAHILLDYEGKCSRFHGHNWRIVVEVVGKVNVTTGMLVDFTDIKKVVNQLDHKTLIPVLHKYVTEVKHDGAIHIDLPSGGEYVFPARDCVLLPFQNATAENLANYLNGAIRKQFCDTLAQIPNIEAIIVTVYESDKSSAQSTLFINGE